MAAGALVVMLVVGAVVIAKDLIGNPRGGPAGAGQTPVGSPTKVARSKARAPGAPARGSPLSPGWRGDGKAVTLAFGGDVHFEGPLTARLAADPATTLDGTIESLLSRSDLSMTNFESALVNGACPDPQPKQFVFSAPPAALIAFKAAHVTLVTEANNHGEDCGRAGLAQSLAIAKAAHFPVIGIGQDAAQAFAPYKTTLNGQRIAVIAATEVIDTDLISSWTATATQPGLASAYQEAELVAAIQRARKVSDTVVVYLHWGTETRECPNSVQIPLARTLVKAGADIVVGAHAHVQLGAGYLGTAFIDYGLGNLAFYDTTAPETYSGALHITITGRHVDSYRWRPALIMGALPVPDTGTAAVAAVKRWDGLRGCTNLTKAPTTTLASEQGESTPFTGPPIKPLGD